MFKYGEYDVKVKVKAYIDSNDLYVGLDYYDEDLGGIFPFSNITINTEDAMGYLEAVIDTNNLGNEVLNFLEENNIAFNANRSVYSGFCKYPVYRFSEDKLFKLCPMEFARYRRAKRGC